MPNETHRVPTSEVAHSDVVRQFQTLVENIPGIVAYMDVVQPDDAGHSIPVYISPQIEDLLGYPRDAWMTDDELWLDVVHPDDAEKQIQADADARANLSTLFAEYRMIAKDGRTVWVSEKAAVVEDPLTGTHYWQGVMVDITDRKLAEEAAAASEHQFRSVFDAAAIGVMSLGLDGRILEANRTLEQVCDYPPGALNGRPFADYLEQGDRAQLVQFTELAAGTRDRWQLEHRFRRNDGSLMWCRTVMALVRDGAERPAHVTAMLEDITDRKLAERELRRLADHDSLTGLVNRRCFHEELQRELARIDRHGGRGALLVLDVDRFKQVNDTLGHKAGDDVLCAVAETLRRRLRTSDVISRIGGDEFAVLVPGVNDREQAQKIAGKLADAIRGQTILTIGKATQVTVSIGVALLDPDTIGPHDDLLIAADNAMYQAKRSGRDRIALAA